jgi:HSP20 family molecular chaperone IbpA
MSDTLKQENRTDAATRERTRGGTTYNPRVDIFESDEELVLYGDLPGVEPGALDVHFENRELVIHGKVAPRQKDVQNYLYREYGVGDFYRAFAIGEDIDPRRISAELKNGVLTVHLPRTEAVKPRRIDVKAG